MVQTLSLRNTQRRPRTRVRHSPQRVRYTTDVPGVRAKDGKVVPTLDRERAKALVDDGTIEGGMLPKVEACLIAAGSGCRAAILDGRSGDAVDRLLAGERVGTVFEAA